MIKSRTATTDVSTEDLARARADLEQLTSEVPTEEDFKIESDTFTPTGKTLGYGCWGFVAEYTDPAGQSWALKRFAPNDAAKRQMKERKLSEEDVMRKEAIPLSAAQHFVVPRIIERDKKGKLFVGMPVYPYTLADRIRKTNQNGTKKVNLDETIKYASQIAKALAYLHTIEGRAHGDLKEDNLFIDDKNNLAVGDLGSSTCVSIGSRSTDPRHRIGDKRFRAPECHKDGSHPDERSDIFSFGAITYKLLTEQEIYDGIENPENISGEEFNLHINEKLKAVPRSLRKMLGRCLAYERYQRPVNGTQLQKDLEKTLERSNTWKEVRQHVRKWTIPLFAGGSMLGIIVYNATTHEPKRLDLPSISPRVQGILYKQDEKGQKPIQFDTERITNLPDAPAPIGASLNAPAKNVTENRVVAYLAKTHGQAAMVFGGRSPYSDKEFETYMAYTSPDERDGFMLRRAGPVWPVVAKAIEVGINQSVNPDGSVDLEDLCATVRVGIEKVSAAKKAANSFDYATYRSANGSDGKLIIPNDERKFIDQWLAYFHADRD